MIKYLPTKGPLPGNSFEAQTVDFLKQVQNAADDAAAHS